MSFNNISIIGINIPIPNISKNTVTIEEIKIIIISFFETPVFVNKKYDLNKIFFKT